MKTFRTLIALAVIAVSSVAFAQGPGGGRPPMGMGGGRMGGQRMKPGERQKKMLEQLKLSPVQKKKTDKLIDEMVAKIQKLRPAGGGRPDPSMRPKFEAIRKDFDGKLAKILTPAQNKKLDDMRKQMRARFGGGRMGGGPRGGAMGGPGSTPAH